MAWPQVWLDDGRFDWRQGLWLGLWDWCLDGFLSTCQCVLYRGEGLWCCGGWSGEW